MAMSLEYTDIFDSTKHNIFPAPWDDYVSKKTPITIQDALYWCEYVVLSNQILHSALKKLVSYFITELEFFSVSPKEADRLKNYFYNTLNIDSILYSVGMDYLIYGNSFTSVIKPLSKSVRCPKCNYAISFLANAQDRRTDFKFEDYKFVFTCLKCGYRGPWEVSEVENSKEDDISIIRWNPHDIIINYDVISQKTQYFWRISPEYKSLIQKGSILHLAYASEDLIEAVRNNTDLMFYDDMVIHLKEPGPAGVRLQGWGLSPILANFRQTWYIEILRRANQAIAYDFIIPLRIISPEPRSGPGEYSDPLLTTRLDSVSTSLESIIRAWRKDPASWFTCPFPIRYQPLGADAGRVIAAPLIEQANIDLITALGMPVEFYKGSISMQAAPFALRVLEGTWLSLHKMFNKFLQRVATKLSNIFRWDLFEVRLLRPTHMDDINKQMAKLQLAMNNMISMSTGLKSIGVSYSDEMKRKMDEQQMQLEQYEEMQEQMEEKGMNEMLVQQQQPGGGDLMSMLGMLGGLGSGQTPTAQGASPSQGVAPPQGQGMDPVAAVLAQMPEFSAQPVSLPDLVNAAGQIAHQLFGMPGPLRNSALRRIRQKNSVIHALVLQELERIDRSAELQGKVQMQQQMQQQAQGNIPPPI